MREIESVADLEASLNRGDSLEGVAIQGVDLRGVDAFASADLKGTVLLGCQMTEAQAGHAHESGALVFPEFQTGPFKPFRNALYTPAELYEGFDPADPDTYDNTLDAKVYRHWNETGGPHPGSILETLARRIHDHAITDSLDELIADGPRKVVAIMGGHGVARGSAQYLRVARISRELTRLGFFMVSGGGPGAMEATHLGAWFAERPLDDLEAGIAVLEKAPTYKHNNWLACAFEVVEAYPRRSSAGESLGIPTWLYGHEPPTPFATHIAKYFANSVREEGLLTIATGGVIFTPGSAGTIQEIFQDACQNHYNTTGVISPMLFLGRKFWTEEKPVYPLLEGLARDRAYHSLLRLTDSEDEVIARIRAFDERS